MPKEQKKQFTLTLLMRVLLGILVVVSIGIFANSVMRYNQLLEEEKELEAAKQELLEKKEELIELIGSQEQAERLLTVYAEYMALLNPEPGVTPTKEEIAEKRSELDDLIQDPESREYIIKIAKEYWELHHSNEILYYNDRNE